MASVSAARFNVLEELLGLEATNFATTEVELPLERLKYLASLLELRLTEEFDADVVIQTPTNKNDGTVISTSVLKTESLEVSVPDNNRFEQDRSKSSSKASSYAMMPEDNDVNPSIGTPGGFRGRPAAHGKEYVPLGRRLRKISATWVGFPKSFVTAKAGNTIVSLPTGAGKTLVAVLCIDHFLEQGAKRVMFVVPTTVLVKQQAQYCRDRCQQRHSVAELSGTKMDSWTKLNWSRCLQDNAVLVGTPEVFRRALVDCGFIQVLDFSLIIFDECHNATGNSPMAGIMRDAVWTLALGLTD
ncbi:DCL3A [Symbiodinium natans]|uniref:DCL3A protein n=1 Tax=Symbiodinium natans TaxID=878477 RepID=A0A812MHV1_9DINO|nr:DCL3A [Symbiodinium natans]